VLEPENSELIEMKSSFVVTLTNPRLKTISQEGISSKESGNINIA